jgi:hypothetical protein
MTVRLDSLPHGLPSFSMDFGLRILRHNPQCTIRDPKLTGLPAAHRVLVLPILRTKVRPAIEGDLKNLPIGGASPISAYDFDSHGSRERSWRGVW